ncbi:hypothetical protein [Bradyrhizobium sp. OK095]|uniref:hypothetical protein n=1 Tax=Bradyrhizobium sp. OK095 TaxID=1882760 RepID=UPI0008C96F73|nr:hypothetical protein [Bradyrhizobium sp. OK095]SEN88289.1 hypothetical protein SAMN05443254_1138 [Bradyrhizobium sp. OK095]
MTLQSDRLSLLQHIVANLDVEAPVEGTITQASLNATPFAKAKIGPMGTVGILKEAGEALTDLAGNIFGGSQTYQRGVTFKDVFDELSDLIIFNFVEKRTVVPTITDLTFVEAELEKWFQGKVASHLLYIPCRLSPWPAPSFSVGPVTFVYVQEFAEHERKRTGAMFDITYGEMFKGMALHSATWIATVEVGGCMPNRAQERGNLAVDIAIAGIQLIVPLDHSAGMTRLTARSVPAALQTVTRSNGHTSTSVTNQEPGLSMGDGTFNHFLTSKQALLKAISPRVSAYVDGFGTFPVLEQAWADSAYWFHEALAEPLDTIAVPKLETAIEVLLRAESTSGSKSRVLKAIHAFYGLTKGQLINPKSQITVEKFATGFVTDRSRILHGTWSTLNYSLRDSRPNLTQLVLGLLARYALELERYGTEVGATDDAEAFLNSVIAYRQTAANVSPPPPAQP